MRGREEVAEGQRGGNREREGAEGGMERGRYGKRERDRASEGGWDGGREGGSEKARLGLRGKPLPPDHSQHRILRDPAQT